MWTLLPGSRHSVARGKGPVSRSLVHLLVAHPKCQARRCRGDAPDCSSSPAGKPPLPAAHTELSLFVLANTRPPLGAVGPQERPSSGLELVTVSPEDRFLNNESSAMGEAVSSSDTTCDEGVASALEEVQARGDQRFRL